MSISEYMLNVNGFCQEFNSIQIMREIVNNRNRFFEFTNVKKKEKKKERPVAFLLPNKRIEVRKPANQSVKHKRQIEI